MEPRLKLRRRRARPAPAPGALLLTRAQTRALLGGLSNATLQRMEARGELTPIRLNHSGGKSTKVFYRRDQVLALAAGE